MSDEGFRVTARHKRGELRGVLLDADQIGAIAEALGPEWMVIASPLPGMVIALPLPDAYERLRSGNLTSD